MLAAALVTLIVMAPCPALGQDRFPPTPDEVMVQIGLLPREATTWQGSTIARRSVARVMELAGLAKPEGGIIRVASGPDDEALLRRVLQHKRLIESDLPLVGDGLLNGLGPEGLRLQPQLRRAWMVIPKLLAAHSIDVFPDIPETHSWYERLANLKKDGILQLSSPWRGPGPLSRLFIAVAIRESCEALPLVATNMLSARPDEAKTFATSLTGLKDLIEHFKTELKILELDPARMQRDVDRAYRGGFADLPATHWAAQSVEALHALGLLDGYSSGASPKFGGSKAP